MGVFGFANSRLVLGGVSLDVAMGTPCGFLQVGVCVCRIHSHTAQTKWLSQPLPCFLFTPGNAINQIARNKHQKST